MCGIAGIWQLDRAPIEPADLAAFTDSLKHRGPDGAGYELPEPDLGLGHRRLSVLDLSEAGRQPMDSADGRLTITYNGEIYNFLELRQELRQLGYPFRSQCDTEVILAAFQCWGSDCQHRFNGMWAFAIFDREKRSLFLSRDRFGVKPLHFVYRENRLFAFASETIAFRHLKGFQRERDENAFLSCFSSHACLEARGHTIYREVHQLLPGHCAQVSRELGFQQKRWWDTLDTVESATGDYTSQVEQFRELFQSACRLRLRADVPIACALSGGIDSSAVYCTVNRLLEEKKAHTAFVATFPGSELDERAFAEQVVQWVQGQAHYLVPESSQLVHNLEQTTQLFDGFSGTPLVCLTDVYRAMREHRFVVSLDGHGADELMFGYRSAVWAAYQNALQQGRGEASELHQIYSEMLFDEERSNLSPQSTRPPSRLRKTLRFVKNLLRKPRPPEIEPNPWLAGRPNLALAYPTPEFRAHESRTVPDPVNYQNFHYAELPYNLRDFDRGSMQHGIEIRMPFLDFRLVRFLFSLPIASKLGGGFTKRILRDALEGVMPESIRRRKLKIGLGSPLAEWFNGILADYLRDEVHSQRFQQLAFLKTKEIQGFVDERCRQRSWTHLDSRNFWPVLNAHILSKAGQL